MLNKSDENNELLHSVKLPRGRNVEVKKIWEIIQTFIGLQSRSIVCASFTLLIWIYE